MAEDFIQKNVQADKDGKWNAAIPNDFGPGQHTVIIKNDAGGIKGVMIFRNPEKTYIIDRIQKVVPGEFFYATILLLLITIILFLNYLVIGKKNRQVERRERTKKYLKNLKRAIVICMILLPLILVTGVATNRNISWRTLLQKKTAPVQEKPFDINGSVVNLSNSGVAGLDLSFGNTSIHTSEGGYFIFNSVDKKSEIKITSPKLKKALLKRVDGPEMRVIFDYDMYNRIIDIVDLESRGKISDIYDRYLASSIKNKVSKDVFIKNYNSIFSDQNILDQAVTIGKVQLTKEWVSKKYDIEEKSVIEIEVFCGSKSKVFDMILEGNNWLNVL